MEKSDEISNKGKLMEDKKIEYTSTPQGTPPPAINNISQPEYQNKLQSSGLPDSIKAIMGETTYGMSVDMGVDLSGVAKKPIRETKQAPSVPQTHIEQPTSTQLSEAQIRTIINEELINFLSKYFTKTLTENIQKNLLVELKKRGKGVKVKK